MTFVATASGDSYIRQAEDLRRGFADFGWPSLVVATSHDFPGMDDLWGGRGLKTRFAHFLPDDTAGPVAFLDCDCRVIGPFRQPPRIDNNTLIAKIRSSRWSPTYGRKFLLQSCLLIFPSLPVARSVCDKWYREAASYSPRIGSDEPALHRAIQGMTVIDIQEHGNPMPNLAH